MSTGVKVRVQALILRTSRNVPAAQQALPLDPAQQGWFRNRIEDNLAQELDLSSAEIRNCTAFTKVRRHKIAFRNRWQFTRNTARAWKQPNPGN